jgi:hypothetical protein
VYVCVCVRETESVCKREIECESVCEHTRSHENPFMRPWVQGERDTG